MTQEIFYSKDKPYFAIKFDITPPESTHTLASSLRTISCNKALSANGLHNIYGFKGSIKKHSLAMISIN